MRCLIASCINDMHLRMEEGGLSTHRIPNKPERNARWLQVLSGTDCFMGKNARICSRHFLESDFQIVNGKRKLKKDAVPRFFLSLNDENDVNPINPEPPTHEPLRKCKQSNHDASPDTSSGRLPLRNITNITNVLRNRHVLLPQGEASGGFSSQDKGLEFNEATPDFPRQPSHFPQTMSPQVHLSEELLPQGEASGGFSSQDKIEGLEFNEATPDFPRQPSHFPQTMSPQVHLSEVHDVSLESCMISDLADQADQGTQKVKRIRYAGDVKDVTLLSAQEALRALPIFQTQLHRTQKRANRLKTQNIWLRKKLSGFSTIMSKLKELNLINDQGEIALQELNKNDELFKELVNGRHGRPYSTDMKRFATTLNFYSAKAYHYVRVTFNNTLPHQRTIVSWYRSIDGEPGLTYETLATIESEAKRLDGRPLLVSLSMDEVAIRQYTEWNPHRKKFDGTVDYGESLSFLNSQDDLHVAKEALVYMVSSVEGNWKLPVAHFFINGIGAADKKNLTETVLTALHDAGATVIGFTFDGTATNFAMANALGCNLRVNKNPLITSFKHPSTNENVYILLDACHMLKLVRNMFSSNGCLLTPSGTAEWQFIHKLNDKQNLAGVKLAHNLSDRHIHFQNQKMKVLLAAQTLSQSVANALEMLKSDDPGFANVDATIEFISIFNDLFDMMNSKNTIAKGFKKPMCEDNFDYLDIAMRYAEDFIRGIKLPSQDPILTSPCKTGFLGFLVNIHSFRGMFNEYVCEKRLLSYIATYRFSQDHVETFFAAIRAKGGSNNNPTVSQFKAAYKRLITHNNVKSPQKANCLDFNESVILETEEKSEQRLNRINNRNPEDSEESENYDIVKAKLLNEMAYADTSMDDAFVAIAIQQDSCSVQKKLLQSVRCKKCVDGVLGDKTVGLVSRSIYIVCKVTEMEFKVLTADQKDFNVGKYYDVLFCCTLQRIQSEFNDIFETLTLHILEDNEANNNHRIDLIKLTIDCYLKLRLSRYAKTIIPFKQSTRSKLTKLILFEGH